MLAGAVAVGVRTGRENGISYLPIVPVATSAEATGGAGVFPAQDQTAKAQDFSWWGSDRPCSGPDPIVTARTAARSRNPGTRRCRETMNAKMMSLASPRKRRPVPRW